MSTPLHLQGPVLLTADLHIGKYQYGLPEREADYLSICRHLVALAQERVCRTLLILGDTFDNPNPSARSHHALMAVARGSPLYIGAIQGNHDHGDPSWFDELDCPIHDLNHQAIEINGCRIEAVPYAPRSRLLEHLATLAAEEQRPDVLLTHALFEELAPFPGTGQISSHDLTDLHFEELTVFAGDIHTHSEFRDKKNRFTICYPGSPEMTETGEGRHHLLSGDLRDHRTYALLWNPAPGPHQQWERIPLPNRPWFTQEVRVDEPNWTQHLPMIIAQANEAQNADPARRPPIVHLQLTGETNAAIDREALNAFLKELKAHCLEIRHTIRTAKTTNSDRDSYEELLRATDQRLSHEDALQQLRELCEEATQKEPQQRLILDLIEEALKKDRTQLRQYASLYLTPLQEAA